MTTRDRRAPIVFAAVGALALLAAGTIVVRTRDGEPSPSRVDASASAASAMPTPVRGVDLEPQRVE